jgi:hypothetical protein
MAELADAADSKSADLRVLGVRLPLPAPRISFVDPSVCGLPFAQVYAFWIVPELQCVYSVLKLSCKSLSTRILAFREHGCVGLAKLIVGMNMRDRSSSIASWPTRAQ